MAEYGEWNRKGGALSDATAQKEYGISQEFIVEGIKAGKLEWREASIWGNPTFKILRGQLERYIAEQRGAEYLSVSRDQTELRKIKREMAHLKRRMNVLQARRAELEKLPSGKSPGSTGKGSRHKGL